VTTSRSTRMSGRRSSASSTRTWPSFGQLMKSGADLTQSRHVIYYSYAPTEPVAQAMAREAETKGFDAATREAPPNLPGQWSVISEIDAVTSPEFVRESDDFFQGLADRHGAEYDGWEASL
jgi:hypothetical protein